MNFRRFEALDTEAVVEIFRSNIPKYFLETEEPELREFLADHVENYYVLELDGKVVGAGGIALNADDTVSLCWGMVHNDHLGTGLGRLLTEFRLARSHEMFGARSIVTSTSQHTAGFYEKLGFVTVEYSPDGFGPGIDICKMRKEAVN